MIGAALVVAGILIVSRGGKASGSQAVEKRREDG
jgi:hypothetical protein